MKHNILIAFCFLLLVCCSKSKSQNMHTTKEILPYSDDDLKKYVPHMVEVLKNGHYQFPSHEDFRQKVLDYYSIDIDTCKFNDNETKDTGYSDVIFINERFVSTYQTWEEFDKTVYKEGVPKDEDFYMLNFNKLVFTKDPSAFTAFIQKDSSYFYSIIARTGFYFNENMLKTAISSIGIYNKDNIYELIFDQYKPEGQKLRKKILEGIGKYKPDALTTLISSFPSENKNLGYTQFTKDEENEIIANILNELIKSDNKADVNIYFDDHPNYMNILKSEKFYNFPLLEIAVKNYIPQKQRDVGADEIHTGIINDPDGYTNLRKDKSTQAEVIQKIKSGISVQILDDSGDWWKIATDDGKQGYIHKSRIKSE
ncbi:SH3 domain-containing protein [Chryseobacterium lactis]|uniref:SH3 domain-containing protein n=2 Tax=Chryseobacterium lactis TaxID=1241981 RepID=UPI00162580F6|nr:SH3 domain-containing protein [Chryseobacterium lactis]